MTANELDLDALHATLDADPADQTTRRILADLYEEAGEAGMALGLRWMTRTGVIPAFTGDGWWQCRNSEGGQAGPKGPFVSRRAAEEALCLAYAEMSR